MTTVIRSYKDLIAWQLAVRAGLAVYRASSRFPHSERFGLTNQLRRAAVSIASNIAEGYGRGSRSDYSRFCRMARASLYEVETQMEFAIELGYLDRTSYEQIQEQLSECGRVLAGLLRSLEPVPASS